MLNIHVQISTPKIREAPLRQTHKFSYTEYARLTFDLALYRAGYKIITFDMDPMFGRQMQTTKSF